jgi:TPR repeat protein
MILLQEDKMKLAIRHLFLVSACIIPLQLFAAPNTEQQKQFSTIQQQARQGNPKAMVALGYAYEKGELIDANAKEASVWFQRASDQGSSTGMVNLALLYTNGEGVTKDHHKAFALFEQAANLNDISGLYYLARCYTEGIVVEENFLVTFSLLTLILEEGKGTYDKDSFVVSETEEDDETEYIKANVYSAAQEILSLMTPDLEDGEQDDVIKLTQAMRKKGNVTTAIKTFLQK